MALFPQLATAFDGVAVESGHQCPGVKSTRRAASGRITCDDARRQPDRHPQLSASLVSNNFRADRDLTVMQASQDIKVHSGAEHGADEGSQSSDPRIMTDHTATFTSEQWTSCAM